MSNEKYTKRFLLIDPELFETLQTQLKYGLEPEVRNLTAVDRELRQLLDSSDQMPIHETKRRIAEALRKIQIFKAKPAPEITTVPIQPTTAVQPAPEGMVFQRRSQPPTTPISRTPPGDRLMTPQDFQPRTPAATATSTPLSRTSASPAFLSPPSQSEFLATPIAGEQQVTPQAALTSNFQDAVLKQLNKKQAKQAEPILRIIDEVSDDILQIDPTSLSVSVHGKTIPSSHLVNIIKRMQNTLSGSPIPPGYEEVIEALAKHTNMGSSLIKSPHSKQLMDALRQHSPSKVYASQWYKRFQESKLMEPGATRSSARRRIVALTPPKNAP